MDKTLKSSFASWTPVHEENVDEGNVRRPVNNDIQLVRPEARILDDYIRKNNWDGTSTESMQIAESRFVRVVWEAVSSSAPAVFVFVITSKEREGPSISATMFLLMANPYHKYNHRLQEIFTPKQLLRVTQIVNSRGPVDSLHVLSVPITSCVDVFDSLRYERFCWVDRLAGGPLRSAENPVEQLVHQCLDWRQGARQDLTSAKRGSLCVTEVLIARCRRLAYIVLYDRTSRKVRVLLARDANLHIDPRLRPAFPGSDAEAVLQAIEEAPYVGHPGAQRLVRPSVLGPRPSTGAGVLYTGYWLMDTGHKYAFEVVVGRFGTTHWGFSTLDAAWRAVLHDCLCTALGVATEVSEAPRVDRPLVAVETRQSPSGVLTVVYEDQYRTAWVCWMTTDPPSRWTLPMQEGLSAFHERALEEGARRARDRRSEAQARRPASAVGTRRKREPEAHSDDRRRGPSSTGIRIPPVPKGDEDVLTYEQARSWSLPSSAPAGAEAEFHFICCKYALLFHLANRSLRNQLLSSKSTGSDELVRQFLALQGISLVELEADAVRVAQYAWHVHVGTEEYGTVLARLGSLTARTAPDVFRFIVNTKRDSSAPSSAARRCALFFCGAEGAFRMNSFDYCADHYGLALLNARRHLCRACEVFNLLVLRDTPDEAHEKRHTQNVCVPVGGGQSDRFCSRWFCRQTRSDYSSLRLVPGTGDDGTKVMVDVGNAPNDSIVYMDGAQMVAWVQLRVLEHDGEWVPVRDVNLYVSCMLGCAFPVNALTPGSAMGQPFHGKIPVPFCATPSTM